MKLFSTFLILSWVIGCSALQMYAGDHSHVVPSPEREYTFSYHTGFDDYHFYGSNVWAVRFDFPDIYPAMDTCEFAAVKALLYLPQTTDSVRVELFTENAGMPGTSLTWEKVPVSSNYLEVPFDSPVQGDVLWMVVTYSTNFANRFVSASMGEGTHSYYWNTNVANPYFQSFASAGYGAELLFGLGGDFVMSGTDLELVNYDLVGVLEPREVVGHTFSVYNHSSSTITDAVLEINVYSPDSEYAFYDPITISGPIPPNSLYEFTSQSSGYAEHQFSMPSRPMQLKVRAQLNSGLQNDPQANNVILLHRFCFEDTYPVYLVENFLRTESSPQITNTQDQNEFTEFHKLNYFPILSDSLGNVPAQIRFNWYGFNTLPRTVINGEKRINGFSPNYADTFIDGSESALSQRTFITSSQCRLSYDPDTDLLSASLTLENSNSMLYNSATEYNLISQLRLNVGMFKREHFDGADRYVISRWITHNAALDGSLGAGESYSTEYNIPLNYITLDELSQNYRLYYWLQLSDGNKIFYSNWTGFDTIVANQDDLLAAPRILIHGNPVYPGSTLRFSLDNTEDIIGLQIFNTRGQLVYESSEKTNEVQLSSEQFPASGIYLIRVYAKSKNGQIQPLMKKITIIR